MQDALGLKKMTTFMADNDLESGTDGESNSRDERIPKANAIDVFGARADHEFPAGFVSGEKAFENGSANLRRGPDLRWSRSSLGDRRRLDKAANKPAPEPPWTSEVSDLAVPHSRPRSHKAVGLGAW